MITRSARIPRRKQTALLRCFVVDTTASQAAILCKVSRPCANRWYRHWRELIYSSTRHAPRFSGEVEIDIGFFSGRAAKKTSEMVRRLAGLPVGKIVARRRVIAESQAKKQMVLGILRRGGDIHLLPIKDKSRHQLESAVRLVVEIGTVIYSDMEKGLANLRLDAYIHKSINHSLEYVDKDGNHLNGIESFWREARRSMGRNFRGIPRSTLMLHIKEREFRYNHSTDMASAMKSLASGSL